MELDEKYSKNLYHYCKVVPYNTTKWIGGYIAGAHIIENKVFYAILTSDYQRIIKNADSKFLQIFEETEDSVKIQLKARSVSIDQKKSDGENIKGIETMKEYLQLRIKYSLNVGKIVYINELFTIGDNPKNYIKGRISKVHYLKDTNRFVYAIGVEDPLPYDPLHIKYFNRYVDDPSMSIIDIFDTKGEKLQKKYKKFIDILIKASQKQQKSTEELLSGEKPIKAIRKKISDAESLFQYKKHRFENIQNNYSEYENENENENEYENENENENENIYEKST